MFRPSIAACGRDSASGGIRTHDLRFSYTNIVNGGMTPFRNVMSEHSEEPKGVMAYEAIGSGSIVPAGDSNWLGGSAFLPAANWDFLRRLCE